MDDKEESPDLYRKPQEPLNEPLNEPPNQEPLNEEETEEEEFDYEPETPDPGYEGGTGGTKRRPGERATD
jgi:hypothetical protein